MSTVSPSHNINLVIDISDLLDVDEESLAEELAAASRVLLLVPFSHIGNASWNIDIAWDYLAALFVGETIAPICSEIFCSIHWVKVGTSYGRVEFELYPADVIALSEKLLWLSHQFDDRAETGEIDVEDLQLEVAEAMGGFGGELNKMTLRFPHLAEQYSANMVVGMPQLNDDDDDDDMDEHYREHPEHKHDFWRSHYSNIIGADFYVSTDDIGVFIIPIGIDADAVLRGSEVMLPDAPRVENARLLTGKDVAPVVFNQIVMVLYPARAVSIAQDCARDIWPDRYSRPAMSFRLNEIGDMLIAEDGLAQYVIFSPSPNKIRDEEARLYLIEAEQGAEALRTYLGIPTRMACSWDTFDDDKFGLFRVPCGLQWSGKSAVATRTAPVTALASRDRSLGVPRASAAPGARCCGLG